MSFLPTYENPVGLEEEKLKNSFSSFTLRTKKEHTIFLGML